MDKLKLTMMVAMTRTNGIGNQGELGWKLLEEIAYFRNVTCYVPLPPHHHQQQQQQHQQHQQQQQQQKQQRHDYGGVVRNVVMMGRKTYLSIPSKFRPLKQRFNVVISSSLNLSEYEHQQEHQRKGEGEAEGEGEGLVRVVSTVEQALEYICKLKNTKHQEAGWEGWEVGRVFVIGGAQLYTHLLTCDLVGAVVDKLLVTRIWSPLFGCDTFFPEFRTSKQVRSELTFAKRLIPFLGEEEIDKKIEEQPRREGEGGGGGGGFNLDDDDDEEEEEEEEEEDGGEGEWRRETVETLREYLGDSCPRTLVDGGEMVVREGETVYEYQLWQRR